MKNLYDRREFLSTVGKAAGASMVATIPAIGLATTHIPSNNPFTFV